MPLAETLIGQTVGLGMGMALGAYNDDRQIKQQGRLLRQQQEYDIQQMDYQQKLQYDMWKRTGYKGQKEQMIAAGLNPGLMYGMGGGGGQTTGTASASVNAEGAPRGGGEIMGLLQMRTQEAQIKLMEAQAKKTDVEATKIGGVDTANVTADTENKVLNSIILKYTGKETQAQYEEVNQPNRGIESQTRMYELEARQGIADTIRELWQNGQLANKSNYEIEQLLLQNAKTKEETRAIIKGMDLMEENIKGAKLENIIKDLETRLQTETGIDRTSPAWMKVLGRLFVQLMGGK